MAAQVVDLEDHRRVWRPMRVTCNACGASSVSVVHAKAPLERLECHECGKRDSRAEPVEE